MQFRKYITSVCLLLFLCTAVKGQSPEIDSLKVFFQRQLLAYPQEKIYLHTDKPYYLNGEKIWFRAHLVDAVLHRQATASRYVYVELINPTALPHSIFIQPTLQPPILW